MCLPVRPAGRTGRSEGQRCREVIAVHRCDGHRDGRACAVERTLSSVARVGGVQPDPSRRRWARRRPSLAWQLDDRAAPDTVPMKAVPRQCGALGRLRPALPAQPGGVVGSSSSIVPVRRVPHPGRAVQPLRSRQPVLRPRLLASDSRPRPARGRLSLPALARWTRAARREVPALASARCAASRAV
jgi:hypothetical protein